MPRGVPVTWMRVWLANRGVWESGWWLGPTVSVAHTAADVDHYVDLFGQCLADLVASGPVDD